MEKDACKLWSAVESECLDEIKVLVESKTPIQIRDLIAATRRAKGWTVLHNAAYMDCGKTIQVLLEPLLSAERFQLLAAGDILLWTPLHYAAALCHSSTLSTILQMVEPLEAIQLLEQKTSKGETVLHCMGDEQHPILKQYTKSNRGSNPSQAENYDRCPRNIVEDTYIFLTSQIGGLQRLLSLLKIQDKDGSTFFHRALLKEHRFNSAIFLLNNLTSEKYQLLLIKDKDDKNVLHAAAEQDCVELLNYVLNNLQSAHVVLLLSALDKRHHTPLHYAVLSPKTSFLLCLIKNEQKIGRESINTLLVNFESHTRLHTAAHCCTLLHTAAQRCNIKAIKQILQFLGEDRGCRLMETVNGVGQTALHLLAQQGMIDKPALESILCLLRQKLGHIILIRDEAEKTAADMALQNEVRRTLGKLVKRSKETYLLHKPPTVLLIYSTDQRPEAESEMLSIKTAFDSLGIRADPKCDVSEDEILRCIQSAMNEDISALIVFIMSHAGSGSIKCKGGGELCIKGILRQMYIDPHHIPKMLVLQCCLGDQPAVNPQLGHEAQDAGPQSEAKESKIEIEKEHFVLVTASLNGQEALQNTFIPSLAEAIKTCGMDEGIDKLIERAHKQMKDTDSSIVQTPVVSKTLTKTFCLKSKLFSW